MLAKRGPIPARAARLQPTDAINQKQDALRCHHRAEQTAVARQFSSRPIGSRQLRWRRPVVALTMAWCRGAQPRSAPSGATRQRAVCVCGTAQPVKVACQKWLRPICILSKAGMVANLAAMSMARQVHRGPGLTPAMDWSMDLDAASVESQPGSSLACLPMAGWSVGPGQG